MSKLVWTYDIATKKLVSSSAKEVDDDYVLAAGETFVAPEASLLAPLTFDESGQQWLGISFDDWIKDNGSQKTPDLTSVTLAALAKQVLALQLKGDS